MNFKWWYYSSTQWALKITDLSHPTWPYYFEHLTVPSAGGNAINWEEDQLEVVTERSTDTGNYYLIDDGTLTVGSAEGHTFGAWYRLDQMTQTNYYMTSDGYSTGRLLETAGTQSGTTYQSYQTWQGCS